ncbi:MAG: hypothetical protein OEZ03_01925 [Alphaproteobacteria bacterium]|nr:hypothetical protein [Alphaproteobacteria bacterium]
MEQKYGALCVFLLATALLVASCGIDDVIACKTGKHDWAGRELVSVGCIETREMHRKEAREREEEERRRKEYEVKWAAENKVRKAWEAVNLPARQQWMDMRNIQPYRGSDAAMILVAQEYDESDILAYFGELAYLCRKERNCVPSAKLAIAPAATRRPWVQLMSMDGRTPCERGCAVAPGDYAIAALVRMSTFTPQNLAHIQRAKTRPDGTWATINIASGAPNLDPAEGIIRLEPGRAYAIMFHSVVEIGERYVTVGGKSETRKAPILRYRLYFVSSENKVRIPVHVNLDDSLADIR